MGIPLQPRIKLQAEPKGLLFSQKKFGNWEEKATTLNLSTVEITPVPWCNGYSVRFPVERLGFNTIVEQ